MPLPHIIMREHLHRGRGVYQNLLNFVINILKTEGYTRFGVDFESINPSGSGFWQKFFHSYTNSVVRRIDERILQRVSVKCMKEENQYGYCESR